MHKGYKYLISLLIAGVMISSFIFATDTLNKNEMTKATYDANKIKYTFPDETGSRDVCSDSFTASGAEDLDGDGELDLCWDDGSGYFYFYWEGGCLALEIVYSGGALDLSSYGFTDGFYFYGFEPGVTETFEMTFDSGDTGVAEATTQCATCEELGLVTCWDGSCAETLDDCPDEGTCPDGEVIDCVDNTECWTELWIGDGYCDGVDEVYGANLCCYDNDGGDCTEEECGGEPPEPEQCSGGSFTLVVGGGTWDSEITWALSDGSSGAIGTFELDLPNGDYTFTGYDSYGDGWNGASAILTSSDGCEAMNFTFTVGSESSVNFTLGEVESCEDQGLITCPDGSCAETLDDCPDPDLDPPSNLTATAGDSDISLSWSAPGGGGGGDWFIPCADGSMDYEDCIGTCFNNEDCANATYDGCIEGESTWLGDTFCDDGSWGLDFQCDEYGNDCGDCGPLDDPLGVCDGEGGGSNCPDGQTECWDGSCVDDPSDCPEADCAGSFMVYGSDPDVGICWDDGSGYYWLTWEGGCLMTNINYSAGDIDLSDYGFTDGFYFYGFDPGATETFVVTFEDGSTAAGDATNDCDGGGGGGDDSSCAGYCGGGAPGGCYCDELCEGYGDCCPDACEECGYDCGRSDEAQALYDLYHDEYGNRITNPDVNYYAKPIIVHENGYSIVKSFNTDITRDLNGYNVYRDGTLLDYTTETSFSDGSAMAGTEYCYYVTASYDEGESGASNTACAEIESSVTPGDVNGDGNVNVLDIVIMVNFILGTDTPTPDESAASDVNGDGQVNVLDIVIIVNWILGTDRALNNTIEDATFVVNDNSVLITTESGIGGVQLVVSGNYTISSNSNFDFYENNGTILVFSLEGKDITGELFTFTGELEIDEAIVANWNGEEVSSNIIDTINGYHLSSAYPNPFNPSTSINYTVATNTQVTISVYDIMGRQLESLVNGFVNAGVHTVNWNGANYSSGIYYVKMQAGDYQNTQKLLLMK